MSWRIILAALMALHVRVYAHESKCTPLRGLDSLQLYMQQKNITIAPVVRDAVSVVNRGDKNSEFDNFKSSAQSGQPDAQSVKYNIPENSSAKMQNGPDALQLRPNSYRHVGEHFITESDLETLTKYPDSPAAKQFFDKYKSAMGKSEQHSMQVGTSGSEIDRTLGKVASGDWKIGTTDARGWTQATVTVRDGNTATKYNVVYCSKTPCAYAQGNGQAGPGDVLTLFPICGPKVYNFTPPGRVFQSFCR